MVSVLVNPNPIRGSAPSLWSGPRCALESSKWQDKSHDQNSQSSDRIHERQNIAQINISRSPLHNALYCTLAPAAF